MSDNCFFVIFRSQASSPLFPSWTSSGLDRIDFNSNFVNASVHSTVGVLVKCSYILVKQSGIFVFGSNKFSQLDNQTNN